MSQPRVQPAGLAVDYDRSAWLAGPPAGSRPEEVAAWIDGAWQACLSDFGVDAGTQTAGYLRDLLTEFAERDLGCEFRFLRLRAAHDQPLVARLNVVTDADGLSATEIETAINDLVDPDARWWDDEPQLTVLDETRGLTRRIWFQVDNGVRPVVRHHRHVEECGVDLVLSCKGADLKSVALGTPDLDALAEAIWVVDENGVRR